MRCALVSCHRLEPKQKTSLRGYSLTEVPPLFPLWHLPQFSDTLRLCIYNICLSGEKKSFSCASPYFFLFLILTKQTKIWLQHTRIAMELKEKKAPPPKSIKFVLWGGSSLVHLRSRRVCQAWIHLRTEQSACSRNVVNNIHYWQTSKLNPNFKHPTGESANSFSPGQLKPQQDTAQLVSFMMHILAHCSRKGQTTCVN